MGRCGLDEQTQVEKVAQVLRGLHGYLRRIATRMYQLGNQSMHNIE